MDEAHHVYAHAELREQVEAHFTPGFTTRFLLSDVSQVPPQFSRSAAEAQPKRNASLRSTSKCKLPTNLAYIYTERNLSIMPALDPIANSI